MELNKELAQFGLQYKEDDVYLSLLELGQASVAQIAKKAGIKRTTTYDVLASLIKKGLVRETIQGKKRLFYAEPPEKIGKLLEEKQKKLNELLPALNSIYNITGSKPKIRYYEGKDGLIEVYQDTFNYKGEIVGFLAERIIIHLGEKFYNEYQKKRKEAQITHRLIGPDTKEIRELKRLSQGDRKRVVKILPKDKFPFSIEMNIYGNKIAFMSLKEEMGIIIESNEIADNMRLLFNLAWNGAK